MSFASHRAAASRSLKRWLRSSPSTSRVARKVPSRSTIEPSRRGQRATAFHMPAARRGRTEADVGHQAGGDHHSSPSSSILYAVSGCVTRGGGARAQLLAASRRLPVPVLELLSVRTALLLPDRVGACPDLLLDLRSIGRASACCRGTATPAILTRPAAGRSIAVETENSYRLRPAASTDLRPFSRLDSESGGRRIQHPVALPAIRGNIPVEGARVERSPRFHRRHASGRAGQRCGEAAPADPPGIGHRRRPSG